MPITALHKSTSEIRNYRASIEIQEPIRHNRSKGWAQKGFPLRNQSAAIHRAEGGADKKRLRRDARGIRGGQPMPRALWTFFARPRSSRFTTSAAFAHDMWISRGTYKNPAGEWCCGAEDCGVVSPGAVKAGNRRLFGASARSPMAKPSPAMPATGRPGRITSMRWCPTASRCPRPMAPSGAASGRTARRAASSRRRPGS